MNTKKIAKNIVGECCLTCSLLPIPNIQNYGIGSAKDAKNHLVKLGYTFPHMWRNLPPLKVDALDVSFIIPVYNAEKFLRACLDSLLNQQTRFSYEIICVNDGSTDSSSEILMDYAKKHSQLRVITQKNCGISAARNRGIEEAIGKYVGFIDNDDFVSTDYVEQIMDAAIKNEADIVQTDYDVRNLSSVVTMVHQQPFRLYSINEYKSYMFDFQGYVWGGVMRKRILEKVRFPLGFWYEDMITCLLLLRLTQRVVHLDKIVYHKIEHSENASKILWKSADIKSADQYWLACSLCDYASHELSMPIDSLSYEMLLRELGIMLFTRTKKLKKDARYSIFKLASEYVRSLGMDEYRPLKKQQQILHEALLEGNYRKWKLICLSIYHNGNT